MVRRLVRFWVVDGLWLVLVLGRVVVVVVEVLAVAAVGVAPLHLGWRKLIKEKKELIQIQI